MFEEVRVISCGRLAESLRLRRDDKLTRILAAGARVFAEEGFEGASIRKVATALGGSVSSLYYYFDGKEDLLFHIQYHTFLTLLDNLKAQLASTASAEEKIRMVVRNHLSHFLSNMPELKVCSHELGTLRGDRYRKVEDLRRGYFKQVLEVVRALKPFRPGLDPGMATLSLFGMLNWVYTWYDPARDEGERRLANQITNLFLNGVRGD